MNMKTAVEQDAPGQEEIPAAAVPLQEAEKRGSTGKKEEATKLPAAQEAAQEEALLPEPLRQEAIRGTETAGETEALILAL